MTRHRLRSDTGVIVAPVAAICAACALFAVLCLGGGVAPADAAPITTASSSECEVQR